MSRFLSLLCGLGVLAGCAEPLVPRPGEDLDFVLPAARGHKEAGPSYILSDEGGSTTPDGLGSEWQGSTSIDVVADAGWIDNQTKGYGQSVVNYFASEATSAVDVEVRNGSTVIGTNSDFVRNNHALPRRDGAIASSYVLSSVTCGAIVQATAKGTAWMEAYVPTISGLELKSWGHAQAGDTRSAPQSACPTGSTSGGGGSTGGGSGGGGIRVCYYTEFYDWDGTYLYTRFDGCTYYYNII